MTYERKENPLRQKNTPAECRRTYTSKSDEEPDIEGSDFCPSFSEYAVNVVW